MDGQHDPRRVVEAPVVVMRWIATWRSDPGARRLADRHYNRQRVGAREFVPPGRCLVLVTPGYDALWITSWPFAEYVKHAWAGAWTCSAFRNEGSEIASALILDAVAATRAYFGDPPDGATKGGLVALQLAPDAMPAAVSARQQQELFA